MDIYAIEAILFAKGEAVPIEQIAKGINKDIGVTKELCDNLKEYYEKEKRGIALIEIEGKFQLCSNKEYFENIRKVVTLPKKHELTETLLETLAIIAYKQPITRSQIEDIRGVSATFAVNKLMEYGLICEKGRLDFIGRPILFGTTDDFLKFYDIKSINDLKINNKEDEIDEKLPEQIEIEL
ncbi:MAG: SMC-Scp complex subunit ScpB [Lachnospirales bacterium]